MSNNNFNIFKFLKIDRKETISSQFIVSVLNAKDEANKDNLFLKLLLKRLNCPDTINISHCSVVAENGLSSKVEKDKEYGRADIWIRYNNGQVTTTIIIENKIDAVDQYKQLNNYRKYLNERGPGKLFYLNLHGKPAIPSSTKGDNSVEIKSGNADTGYEIITYSNHIIEWLEEVRGSSTNEHLKLFIKQYIYALKPMIEVYSLLKHKNILQIDSRFREEGCFLLELNFWMSLQEEIQKCSSSIIDARRRYSLQKITQKNRIKRAYGIISGNIRIQIDLQNKGLIIGKGSFDEENNWGWTEKETLAEDVKSLKSLSEARELANQVFKQFVKFKSGNK
ncbi:PD-(D/E)XK nuclease family protein [Marinilabiliaceae bacterium ANBcel2]|nr:PD-(D/E)XK nuclease family protein [Marinilabiliaceae bacterium ANBcel2]